MSFKKNNKNDYSEFRQVPYIAILVCCIIILLIGVYLTVTNQTAYGYVTTGKSGGSSAAMINAPVTITIGAFLASFPLYVLVKNNHKKKWSS